MPVESGTGRALYLLAGNGRSLIWKSGAGKAISGAIAPNNPLPPTGWPLPVDSPTYSNTPVSITTGGRYILNIDSLTAGVIAVTVNTTQPVVIEGSHLKGKGTLITAGVGLADITVRNSILEGVNPNVNGTVQGRAVSIDGGRNLTVQRCDIRQTAGIEVKNHAGSGGSGQQVLIEFNKVRNIMGMKSNGAGGYQTEAAGGNDNRQFLQFNNSICRAWVRYNEVINTFGNSRVEDNINLYRSGGISAVLPVQIYGNLIWGAYPLTQSTGYNGGGIICGDDLASGQTRGWIEAYENYVLGTQNYGIQIHGGHDVWFHDNTVVTSGYTNTGVAFSVGSGNVGLAAYWGSTAVPFTAIQMDSNDVAYVNRIPTPDVRNDAYITDGATGTNTSLPGGIGLTYTDEQGYYANWQNLMLNAGRAVGPL